MFGFYNFIRTAAMRAPVGGRGTLPLSIRSRGEGE